MILNLDLWCFRLLDDFLHLILHWTCASEVVYFVVVFLVPQELEGEKFTCVDIYAQFGQDQTINLGSITV